MQTRIAKDIVRDNVVERDLSYILTGIFFEIQKELGRFCREKQYGDILEQKLKSKGICYQREHPIEIGSRKSNFTDFLIEDRIIIDLKAKPFIEKEDYLQMKRYLEVSGRQLGLILNFRDRYLKAKRILNSKDFVDSDKFVVSNRKKGFTLFEFILYFGILSAVVSVSAGTFISLTKGGAKADAIAEVDSALRFVTNKIKQDIKDATDIGIPAGVQNTRLSLTTPEGLVTYALNTSNPVQIERSVTASGATVTSVITSAKVKVIDATFERYENENPANARRIIGVKADITISYNSNNTDLSYTAGKQIFINSKIFPVQARGGGGGAADQTSTVSSKKIDAPDQGNWQLERAMTITPASNEQIKIKKITGEVSFNGTVNTANSPFNMGDVRKFAQNGWGFPFPRISKAVEQFAGRLSASLAILIVQQGGGLNSSGGVTYNQDPFPGPPNTVNDCTLDVYTNVIKNASYTHTVGQPINVEFYLKDSGNTESVMDSYCLRTTEITYTKSIVVDE